jgi:hypothetical protein
MDFDAAGFLENLFGGVAVSATAPPEPAADGPDAAVVPDGALDAPAPNLFTGWVQRPNLRGRLHWETPDLPEAARWWARCAFDALPELALPAQTGAGRVRCRREDREASWHTRRANAKLNE